MDYAYVEMEASSQFQHSPLQTDLPGAAVKKDIGMLQCNKNSKDHVTAILGVRGLNCHLSLQDNCQLPQSSVISLETDASRVGLEKLSISRTEPGTAVNCPREQDTMGNGKNVLQNYQIPGGIGEKSDSPEMREYKTHVMGSPIFPIRRKIR